MKLKINGEKSRDETKKMKKKLAISKNKSKDKIKNSKKLKVINIFFPFFQFYSRNYFFPFLIFILQILPSIFYFH